MQLLHKDMNNIKQYLFHTFSIPSAYSEVNRAKDLPKSNSAFIENKGQIIDQNLNPNPGVLYLLNTPGFNVQLRKGGFSYDLYRISNIDQRFLI